MSYCTSGFFGCTTSRSFSCVSLSAEMFAGVFTETSFSSQVLPLKIMSRLHWPASGALWDLRFFKHSQPKCSFHLNTHIPGDTHTSHGRTCKLRTVTPRLRFQPRLKFPVRQQQ